MSRIITLALATFLAVSGAADATVCRRPNLEGYEKAAARAKQFLPPETMNILEMAVYIERDPNGLFYFHSNFKSEADSFVTKIGGEPSLRDLETALWNIVFHEMPSPSEKAALRRAMLKDIKVYVSHDIFENDGTTKLDFKGRMQVVFVDPEAKLSNGGLIIRTDRPPPFGAERIEGCCVNGRPPGTGAHNLRGLLHKSTIKSENVRLISLVGDTATADAIAGSSLKKLAVTPKQQKPLSETDIDLIFSKNRGKDIVILGHVEDGHFVTRDASGEIVSSASIANLRAAARKNDVLLVEMGCNTAGTATNAPGPGVGIATRFNTVDAANRLAKALDGSRNLSEFFNKLADETLQVVVDTQTIESRVQYHATYYETKVQGARQQQVGEVTITTRDESIIGRWMPDWFKRLSGL